MRTCSLILIVLFVSTSCSILPNSREAQWAYFEDWDLDDDLMLDVREFEQGYVESGFFRTWAGKKKSVSNKSLADKLGGAQNNMKRALVASVGKDTVASNRNAGANSSSDVYNAAIPSFIDRADSDGDGNVSDQEWARAMNQLADENHDQAVSPLEFYLWQLLRG